MENPGLDTRSRETMFCRERIADVFAEIKPLLQAHWDEIAHYPDIPLCPDYDRYVAAERNNVLRIFTARQGHTLIGYAIYVVQSALHYRFSLQAQQDVLYVCPSYRQGRTGWKLIAHADEQLKAEGCQLVIQHIKAKPSLNFGPMLARMGYELMDEIWVKRLD
jgi:GNAT superfamily N-acetyltransferase